MKTDSFWQPRVISTDWDKELDMCDLKVQKKQILYLFTYSNIRDKGQVTPQR